MNRRTTVFILIFMAAVVGLAVAIGWMQGRAANQDCKNSSPVHYKVTIQNNIADFPTVNGRICDTLTFTNEDSVTRAIAFGPHESHVPYDGISEEILNRHGSFTITFDKVGSYHWHDHIHDHLYGSFTVTK